MKKPTKASMQTYSWLVERGNYRNEGHDHNIDT
jgi:hypothetical protein